MDLGDERKKDREKIRISLSLFIPAPSPLFWFLLGQCVLITALPSGSDPWLHHSLLLSLSLMTVYKKCYFWMKYIFCVIFLISSNMLFIFPKCWLAQHINFFFFSNEAWCSYHTILTRTYYEKREKLGFSVFYRHLSTISPSTHFHHGKRKWAKLSWENNLSWALTSKRKEL